MKGLRFDMEGMYFCCFRQPTSTSVMLTYPVPPFTTIRGLLECAMGLSRDSYFLQDKVMIGIEPVGRVERVTEMCKILKLVTRQTERTFVERFPSAPMFKTFLVNPKYRIYLVGENELMEEIARKLKDPERVCYLGQSDDMVDISHIEVTDVHQEKSALVSSVVEGVHEDCEVVKVPYRFVNDGEDVEMRVISVPRKLPAELEEPVECWRFDTDSISLI
ncbi:MAG: CRISPR-associated protein Cas5 [Theionarchaea archaeon]|nr:CRISPR-associated protein Cas5 [Theionarchaea archaeon]